MNFRYLERAEDIAELIRWHNENSEFVALDTETTDKNPRLAKLIDIQISGRRPDEAFMFDGKHLKLLRALHSRQVWWNFKYDWKVLYHHGLDLRGSKFHDAMLMDHLEDENREHDLDSRVRALYGDNYKERFWAMYYAYLDAPFKDRLDYACRDIVYTGRIYARLIDRVRRGEIAPDLLAHVHRLATALYNTELEGLCTDIDYTVQIGSELKTDIVRTNTELRRLGGSHCDSIELDLWSKEINKYKTDKRRATVEKPEFNFASQQHVTRLLYEELELPVQINPKTRNRTVDDKALEALGDAHPILPMLRQLRKYNKMYSAFIEGILEKVQDGRIYPEFNVNGTVTGRISHSNPNMGQMPSKGEWVKIRGIFVPQPGHKIITCDYGQLEVCIAAHFSMDKNLLRIIHDGASKHDITAESLGIERSKAKTLNFAMQYQCSAKKVQQLMGCSPKEAELIWNKYWETYAGEKKVVDECKAKVDRGEPIVNPFGRERHFPTEFANHWEREAAYRQAYSSLIQGTGGDLTSRAFYLVSEWMLNADVGRALFTIHDEILAEAREDKVVYTRELLSQTMVRMGSVYKLRVPLTVDCSGPLDRWTK